MIIEKIITKNRMESIKVINTKMHSIKKKNITKTGIRVYDKGRIGVSGFIGNGDETHSTKLAKNKLELKIEHPGPLEQGISITKKQKSSTTDIRDVQKNILEFLNENHSDYIFNGVMDLNHHQKKITNSKGLELSDEIDMLLLSLRFKRKDSIKNMEGYIFHIGKEVNISNFNEYSSKILNAMKKEVRLPDKKRLPVIMLHDYFLNRFFSRQLHPEKLYEDSSIFSAKIGEKLFSDRIDLMINRKKETDRDRFSIDDEGISLADNEFILIKNGKLIQGFSDIKTSKKYNILNTASATSTYNGVPTPSGNNISIRPTHENLEDIVKGPAIYCIVSAGGDFTMDGSFASPVQSSLLYDNGEFLGKLPELNIKTDIYSMLDKDFMGVSKNGPYNTSSLNACVFICDIV